MTHQTPRLAPRLALVAIVALALWPFRGVLAAPATTLLGTSIDSVHHAWGLWHVARGSFDDSFWPVGVYGTVIGGPSVVIGALLATIFGAAGAYTLTCALQIALALIGTGLLAERVGGGPWSAPAAALFLLAGRPLLAQIGWGVPEGAAVGWLALALVVGLGGRVDLPVGVARREPGPPGESGASNGLAAILAHREGGPRRSALRGVITGALFGASILENPYSILPVVVIVCVFVWLRLRARAFARLCGEGIGGSLVIGAWLVLAHGDDGNVGTTAVGVAWDLFGLRYVAEGPDGRAHVLGLLRTWEPLRYDGAPLSRLLSRGAADTIGWTPVVFALLAAWTSGPARVALVSAAGLLALAFGSFPFGHQSGVPGPFFFGNLALGLAVRPLTQPVRYLVLVGVALAVAAGVLVGNWAREKKWMRVGLVGSLAMTEGLLAGSPSSKIPTFDLAQWACLTNVVGPVASHVELPPFETSGSAALAAQLVHEQKGTHGAIGGWTPRGDRPPGLVWALGSMGEGPVRREVIRGLGAEGIKALLVDAPRAAGLPQAGVCGGVAIVDLRAIADPPVNP